MQASLMFPTGHPSRRSLVVKTNAVVPRPVRSKSPDGTEALVQFAEEGDYVLDRFTVDELNMPLYTLRYALESDRRSKPTIHAGSTQIVLQAIPSVALLFLETGDDTFLKLAH